VCRAKRRSSVAASIVIVAGAFAVAWFVLGVLAAVVTTWLVRRIWKRRKQTTLATRLIAVVVVVAATFGAVGTFVGMVKVFGAVGGESVDPSQKARILAEGISEAMNCFAFGFAIWIPSAIVAFVLTRDRKGSATRK
jgi:biopolymer transport protein ExbB/TolQ